MVVFIWSIFYVCPFSQVQCLIARLCNYSRNVKMLVFSGLVGSGRKESAASTAHKTLVAVSDLTSKSFLLSFVSYAKCPMMPQTLNLLTTHCGTIMPFYHKRRQSFCTYLKIFAFILQVRFMLLLCMRPKCRERFPSHRLQRKPLISVPGIHQGTCVTHVPWCMSGSLTRGVGENVPGIPGACATLKFTYEARGPCMCVAAVIFLVSGGR